ncbi:hypothetical protein VNO80_23985 [Phaseolus coccineus]|uniref:Uncharacterized protein n=1 Tax=Phaseolus coccineus TaxID=3886 RepID=A0AAN9QNS2_PHACN
MNQSNIHLILFNSINIVSDYSYSLQFLSQQNPSEKTFIIHILSYNNNKITLFALINKLNYLNKISRFPQDQTPEQREQR